MRRGREREEQKQDLKSLRDIKLDAIVQWKKIRKGYYNIWLINHFMMIISYKDMIGDPLQLRLSVHRYDCLSVC